MPRLFQKRSGTWSEILSVFQKQGGTWTEILNIFQKIGGTWTKVFAGLKEGYPNYSDDWSEAKPLSINNTAILLREKGIELISENKF